LEGKNIWILRSSPLDGKLLMRSKIDFHFSVNAFPALILAVVGTIMLKMEALDMVLVIVYTLGFSYLISSFGMMMGTIRANIDWTNPVVPIKQSMAVMIVLFSGWVLAIAYPRALVSHALLHAACNMEDSHDSSASCVGCFNISLVHQRGSEEVQGTLGGALRGTFTFRLQ
ncbi:MAG: hypothetical protein KIG41_05610, partial [Sphaerochaetaceae bacterium]|nr:hypothetical protein [Sphaerochaetaceae bacterium]